MYVYNENTINIVGGIRLDKDKDKLIINIDSVNERSMPVAFIINYTGEVLEKYELTKGINTIDNTGYSTENYSIRIVNDKNVVTQKI